ncbi:MAG: hypothetical protein HYT64_02040 [Candidatus Yanofskybacteria bacterium]|nr:hypothetical protein [Candidatus Yanofskybacteria bacterium]
MTEVEKARVVVKIDELEREKRSKELKLDYTRSSNREAWDTYRSKLCVMGMEAEELNMAEEICELDRKITYLKDCLRDNRDLKKDSEVLVAKIKGFDEKIETLRILRKTDQDTLKWASFALNVCNGEQ